MNDSNADRISRTLRWIEIWLFVIALTTCSLTELRDEIASRITK